MDVKYVWTHNEHNKSVGVQSAPDRPVYRVSVSYSMAEKKWHAYMCMVDRTGSFGENIDFRDDDVSVPCKGFNFKMSCKHIKFVDEYMKNFPRPEHGVPQPLIDDNIYRCTFCHAINFMIVAPHGFASDHTIVCLKCGRGYLI